MCAFKTNMSGSLHACLFDKKVQALENSSTGFFNWPEVFPPVVCYLNNAWSFLMKRDPLVSCV